MAQKARWVSTLPRFAHFLSLIQQDARLWPHVHCYGTGSCRSEPGSGGLMRHTRNRTCVCEESVAATLLWADEHPFFHERWSVSDTILLPEERTVP